MDQSEFALLCGMVLVLRLPVTPDCIDSLYFLVSLFSVTTKMDVKMMHTGTEFCILSIAKGGGKIMHVNLCCLWKTVRHSRIWGSCMKLSVNYHVPCMKVILVIQSAVPHVYMVSLMLYVMLLIVKTLPLFVYLYPWPIFCLLFYCHAFWMRMHKIWNQIKIY